MDEKSPHEAIYGKTPESEIELLYNLIQPSSTSKTEKKYFKDGDKVIERDEPDFKEMFTSDLATGNLSLPEMHCVRDGLLLSHVYKSIEKEFGLDLKSSSNFNLDNAMIWAISSKSKEGFMSWLVRTTRAISEGKQEQYIKDMNVQQPKKKKWGLF